MDVCGRWQMMLREQPLCFPLHAEPIPRSNRLAFGKRCIVTVQVAKERHLTEKECAGCARKYFWIRNKI